MFQVSHRGIVIGCVISVVLIAPYICLEWITKTAIDPYNRGFYCDDQSIRYTFKEDTVSTVQYLAMWLIIGNALIIAFEVIRLCKEAPTDYETKSYTLGKVNVHRLIARLFIIIGSFIFGLCLNQFLTFTIKYSVGRLRPYFLDVCKPNLDGFPSECCSSCHTYVNDYFCEGSDELVIHEARLSFPSGHSSYCFYSAFFLCLFLQARVFWCKLGLPFVQFSVISLAFFVAWTRIGDHAHHLTDVIAGALLGIVVAICTVVFVGNLFSRREFPSKTENETIDTEKSDYGGL